MILIVCLDNKNGMQFGGRRQSRDFVVCSRILEITSGSHLWMNAYSGKIFQGVMANIRIDNAFLENAGAGDFCFAENVNVAPFLDKAEKLIVFRWNRHYPADLRFPGIESWNKISTEDFPGNSHDKITMEVYLP